MTLFRLSPALLPIGSVALGLLLGGCRTTGTTLEQDRKVALFAKVRPVLERSCVHCHAVQRLPGMPALTNTQALTSLTGPGKLIFPGSPERSRFFQVVTLSDHDVGAMPPTGHGLPKREVEALRTWILEGAPVPDRNMDLTPQGVVPRSR